MKHFASVLRSLALEKPVKATANKVVVNCFNRKELIEILKKRFEGSIPKQHNLMEMENEELFKLIGDEMYLISYMSEKWSLEVVNATSVKKVVTSSKPNLLVGGKGK